jgi:hypothetical protein
VFHSIRAQLTAWLALLVTLCLAAFAVYLYVAVAHILTDEQNEVPRVQAQQVAAAYDFPEPGEKDYKTDSEHNQQRVDTSIGGENVAARVWAEVFDPCLCVSRSTTRRVSTTCPRDQIRPAGSVWECASSSQT